MMLEFLPWVLIMLSWAAVFALVAWLVWTLHRVRQLLEEIAAELKRR